MQGVWGAVEMRPRHCQSLNWAWPSAQFFFFCFQYQLRCLFVPWLIQQVGGRGHSFSESAQAQMVALDYPVECSLFADEETEAWGHSQSGWQCSLLMATPGPQNPFLGL